MDPHSLFSPMSVKAQSSPDVRLGSKESKGSGLPGSTGHQTVDRVQPSLFSGISVKHQSTPDVRLGSKESNGSGLPGSTGHQTVDRVQPSLFSGMSVKHQSTPDIRVDSPIVHRQEATLPVKSPDRNIPHELSRLLGERPAPPSETSPRSNVPDRNVILDLLFSGNNPRSNATTSGLRMEDKTVTKLFQPETPIRPGDSDRTQSTGAISTEKQGPQPSSTPRPLGSPSIAVDRPSSAPPTAPSMSALQNPEWSRGREESDDSNGEFQSTNEASDEQDESFASSPSPSHERRSIPTTLICRPLPGALDVIWEWKFTERRKLMYQALSSILHKVCNNLKPTETLPGFIYAFKVKDPQGRGYVKIGVTQDFASRSKAHEKCYGKCEGIYPPAGETPVCIGYAHRVENLIHAELVEYAMVLEQCPKHRQVHRSHREWFDIEEKYAVAVIRKWCQWISSSPYEEVPVDAKYQTQETPRRRKSSRKPSTPSTPSKPSKPPEPPPKSQWRLKPMEDSFIAKIWPLALTQDIDVVVDKTRLLEFRDES